MPKGGGKNEGRVESSNNKTQSHYSLDVFSVCVFFNQKPQIAATQKMTINHPEPSAERKAEIKREREREEEGERV